MKLQITLLGTGSAVPTAERNHTGILASFDSEKILFDCGEGIQRQFKIAKINPCKLTRIFITHWHGDHTLGLTGLLETLSMNEFSKTLNIYGPKGTKNKMDLLQNLYGKFKINLKINEITSKPIEGKDFIIKTASMSHKIPTNAYSLILKDKVRLDKAKLKKLKLPNSSILGKLQQGKDITHPKTNKKIRAKSLSYIQKGKKLTIIIDTKINNNAIKLAKNSDVLICESSYSSIHKKRAKEYMHLMSKEAAEIAKKAKAKKLVLTHISQRYQKNTKPILEEAKRIFKKVSIAKDFDELNI